MVILGAGAAGLAAFRHLRDAGCDAVLLEARDRLGGRIWTLHPPAWPAPVELGAEFVHSELPGLALETHPEAGRDYTLAEGELLPAGEFASGADAIFERLAAARGPDQSFAAFLDAHCQDLSAHARAGALAFIEGYEAADPARISVASLQREFAVAGEGGPHARRPRGGYVQLWAGLDLGECLWLNAVVRRVAWRPGAVTVTLQRDGTQSCVRARAAIVALPLAVLQADVVSFDPPLDPKRAALAGLVTGAARRVVLRLRERFWESLSDDAGNRLAGLRFLFGGADGAARFPVWWADPRAPQMTGWAGGRRAAALAALPAVRIRGFAVADLAARLRVPAAAVAHSVLEAHTHDWQSDPFARGAYSYATVGAADAHSLLAAPLQATLFFASEATEASGHHATVPGAVASGHRAADEVLASL